MDFAEKVGISRQHACRIESGERIPSLDLLIKIAEAFNITVDELLGRQLNPQEENELYSLLTDCSPEESTILLQNMKSLKSLLHKFKIN
jgi:transcriptional regulator with XRE-family HTH domain